MGRKPGCRVYNGVQQKAGDTVAKGSVWSEIEHEVDICTISIAKTKVLIKLHGYCSAGPSCSKLTWGQLFKINNVVS